MKALTLGLMVSFATHSFALSNPSKFQHYASNIKQSISLVRVSDGKVLYDYQGSTQLVPASVSKLISSAAVLSHLGPNYRFTTRFYYSGSLKSGTISGDLIVVGDGDPLLLSEDLWQIAHELKNRGLHHIRGNIIIDNSLFGSNPADRWSEHTARSTTHSYDAPITAFGVNFNTLTLAVRPGSKLHAPAEVLLDPLPQPLINIDSSLSTTQAGSKEQIQVERIPLSNGGSTLRISGTIPLDAAPKKIYRSVHNPLQTAGEYLRAFLADQEISVTGATKAGALPKSSTLLYSHQGRELSQIVRSLLFFSNNYIADVLVSRLGASLNDFSAGSTWQRGLRQIDNFLQREMHWNSEYTFISGSGLSNENRLSAEKLSQFLRSLTSQWRYFPEFLASLPIAGQSGTLVHRFNRGAAAALQGAIRAKTGTHVDPMAVSALAGYVEHPTHHLIAFAIIQNGYAGKAQPTIDSLHQNEERGLAEILEIL
jgi:D-alanyl-D-alanine carboxypeptidase/D-alanyl-D-alanine-endopeptidase (penicillin-binding protein 4)